MRTFISSILPAPDQAYLTFNVHHVHRFSIYLNISLLEGIATIHWFPDAPTVQEYCVAVEPIAKGLHVTQSLDTRVGMWSSLAMATHLGNSNFLGKFHYAGGLEIHHIHFQVGESKILQGRHRNCKS